jgi:hypothetical protein
MDPADAHALRAFELLGEADAVIANLLQDPTDQVARVQAQLWQRELDDLDAPVCGHYRRGAIRPDDSQQCLDCGVVFVSDG